MQAQEQEITSTRDQLQSVRNQLHATQAELDELRLCQATSESEKLQAVQQINSLEQKAKALEVALAKAQQTEHRLRQKVEDDFVQKDLELREMQEKLNKENSILRANNNEKNQQLSQERSALNEAISKLLNEKQELSRDLETTRAQLQRLEPGARTSSPNTENVRFEGTNMAIDVLRKKSNHLRLENQQLKQNLDEFKSYHHNVLNRALDVAKSRGEAIGEAEAKVQTLKQEVAIAKEAEKMATEREQAAVEAKKAAIDGEQAAVKTLQRTLYRQNLVPDDKASIKRNSRPGFGEDGMSSVRSKRVKIDPDKVIELD